MPWFWLNKWVQSLVGFNFPGAIWNNNQPDQVTIKVSRIGFGIKVGNPVKNLLRFFCAIRPVPSGRHDFQLVQCFCNHSGVRTYKLSPPWGAISPDGVELVPFPLGPVRRFFDLYRKFHFDIVDSTVLPLVRANPGRLRGWPALRHKNDSEWKPFPPLARSRQLAKLNPMS